MIGEIIFQGVFEVACYGVGKMMAIIFLPHIGIEPLEKQKAMPPWKWRGLTYEKSGKRFLYTESLQLLGLAMLIILGIGLILVMRHAGS